ncbi:MAG: 2-dehydropantoate 2-reductase [Chloroflexota bacterium]
MRVIVYGAGAIGGTIGGHLGRAGYDVILIARPGQAKAVNEQGLKLITPTATHIVKVKAFTHPGQISFKPDDVVFITVKGQNTVEVLSDLKKAVRDIPVFCFQNGVRNEEVASGYFSRVYGVMMRLPTVYLKDGEVIARRDPPGFFVMGRYPRGKDELVEAVAKELRGASFYVLVADDVMPYKWDKLLLNLGNAVGAITNARGKDVERINEAVRDEAKALLRAGGIRWVSDEELARESPEFTAPPKGVMDTEALSSTWQSLARGRDVETDYLNGEIVRLAQKLGRKAPMNEKLLSLCKEMGLKGEKPGKYTAAQLDALLGIKS